MSKERFSIQADWKKLDECPAEVEDTYADLKIEVNGWIASENYDSYSKYMRESTLVSAYPMALWIASYWWRILYEPCPSKWFYEGLSYGWRSAHELTSSGNGFIWPPLRFIPFGERVLIILQPSSMHSHSNAQYISAGMANISRDALESGLNDFVTKTINRLELMGHRNTELQNLWLEVEKERRDRDSNFYRIIEASLGYNPDEGPDELIDTLADRTETAGIMPIFEIAAACSKEAVANPHSAVDGIINVNGKGLPASFNYGRFQPEKVNFQKDKPWEIGHDLARKMRRHLGYGNDPIKDEQLASLFELRSQVLTGDDVSIKNLSMGVPSESNPDQLKIYLHQKHLTGRRFYLARILGERLLNAERPANWLPATFGLTWRQKYQRAFASEFLCPFHVLHEQIATANPDDDIDDIFVHLAQHYIMDADSLKNHWRQNKSDGRTDELMTRSLYWLPEL
jgi:hypothetical protein